MNFYFPDNLRFNCLKCGICCGDTGQKKRHILLLKSEAKSISQFTGLPIFEFAVRVDHKAPYVYEMRKTVEDGKCLHFKDGKCLIYSERPMICRFYPFELRDIGNAKMEFYYTSECQGLGVGKILSEKHFRRLFRLARTRLRA